MCRARRGVEAGGSPARSRHCNRLLSAEKSDPFRGEACLNTGTRYPQGVRHADFDICSRRQAGRRSRSANCCPGSSSPASSACSASISSAPRRARPRSSRACTCMNSCTTAAICSASPATEGAAKLRLRREPRARILILGQMDWLCACRAGRLSVSGAGFGRGRSQMTTGSLLWRGMIVGFVAALLVVRLFENRRRARGRPRDRLRMAMDEAKAKAEHDAAVAKGEKPPPAEDEPELVSRPVQARNWPLHRRHRLQHRLRRPVRARFRDSATGGSATGAHA